MRITLDSTELSELLNYRIQNSGYDRSVKPFEELEDEIFQDILALGKGEQKTREHVGVESEKILICGLDLADLNRLVDWLNALLYAVHIKDWGRVKDHKASDIQQYIDIMQRAKCDFGPQRLENATEMFGTLLFHVQRQEAAKIKEMLAYIFITFAEQSITQVARLQLRLV